MEPIAFQANILFLGYGAVAQCTLPILEKHLKVNLNQIYFENILKELLKELRSDSEKNKSLSFFGFITSKIQNIFR